jgi:hypothetical protein
MSNISLTKLTVAVAIASLSSTIVFASDTIDSQGLTLSGTAPSFSDLLTSYDIDKNKMLSVKELPQDKADVKVLNEAFVTIDTNKDQQISEQEFKHYFASQKKSLS